MYFNMNQQYLRWVSRYIFFRYIVLLNISILLTYHYLPVIIVNKSIKKELLVIDLKKDMFTIKKFLFLTYIMFVSMMFAIILYLVGKDMNISTFKTLKTGVRICNCTFPSMNVKTNIYRLISSVDSKHITLHGYGSWDFISKSVEQRGYFEPEIDRVVNYLLTRNPSALFMDIGANIGIRSLQVAKYGRKVIAVEALQENVYRLCNSIKDNGVSDKVIVIHNALAERQKVVQFGRYKDCMGCSFVADDEDVIRPRKKGMRGLFEEKIPAVTLDDFLKLEDVNSSKSIFMKIDIEGYEHHILDGAHEFFKSKDVIGMVMEWKWHRGLDSGLHILEFMRKHKFLPFRFNSHGDKYVLLRWMECQGNNFPNDILWLSAQYMYQVLQI